MTAHWHRGPRTPGHVVAGLVLLASVAGAVAQPARRGRDDHPFDAWMARAMSMKLEAAKTAEDYRALAAEAEGVVLARLALGQFEDIAALSEMLHVWRACRVLPDAQDTHEQMAAFLVAEKPFAKQFFRAVAQQSPPGRQQSLKTLAELYQADPEAVAEYPGLAIAFATAKPARYHMKGPEPASLVESFQWYTNPKLRFAMPLKRIPYELAHYLANTRLSIAERQWAYVNYHKARTPAKCYFDVSYDYDHFLKGEPKKISKLPFTLMNLKKVGGVCIEQAYYAAQVCKALGIPATVVVGVGRSGIGHAWVAFLQARGDQAAWNSSIGRYEVNKYFVGNAQDPTTGGKMLDSEMAIVGIASQLSRQRLRHADAAAALARLAHHRRGPADAAPLTALAAWYKARTLADDSPEADANALPDAGPIDQTTVEDLLAESIENNLAHKPAWDFIVELRKAGQLPVDHLSRFFDVLMARTAAAYPDYSAQMVMAIIPTIDNAEHRQKVYKRAVRVYRGRPDLQGRLMLALGDDLAEQGQKAEALNTYETTARQCVGLADIVIPAAGRAEMLLRDAGRVDLAIKMYAKLFKSTKRQKTHFYRYTSHYKLGKRLAQLLADAGEIRDAERVEEMISTR